MSEVKRYDVLQDPEDYCDCGNSAGSIEVESADGEYVRASAYDAAQSELSALREELANHDSASMLINAWVAEHKSQMPWDKAIELIAVVTKMPDAEKQRLLCLDDQYELMTQRLTAAEQRNAELDLEWSRTITERALITLELHKAKRLLEEVLSEVPHGWGASFSESELAERIRQAIPVRYCDTCEQYVPGPCSSWDCSTPEVENWTKPTESGVSDAE